MPSLPKPTGTLPETKVVPQDVKQAAVSSEAAKEEIKAKAETPAEPEADESDLQTLQEEQKVPYSRFKEKNEEAKRLKAEIADKDRRYQEDLRRALAEKEAALSVSRNTPQGFNNGIIDIVDPVEKETKVLKSEVDELKKVIASMQGQSNEERLLNHVSKLENKYPEADTLAVLGWKKQQPHVDLEELMELSHTRNVERAEKKLKTILEQKKQRAKSGPTLTEAGYKLKESDKPKSVKEANALLKRIFSS